MIHTIIRWADRVLLALAAGLVLVLLVVMGTAHGATSQAEPGGDYHGPFTTMKVPTLCSTAQANLRYYTASPPDADAYLRSGEHGHGDRIACIYFASETLTGKPQYGKWLIFTPHGWLIAPVTGNDVTYVDCVPPLRFPNPPSASTPNDCAESWGTGEGASVFTTGPNTGQPMIPGSTP